MAERPFVVSEFRGLNDYNSPALDPSRTRSLDNVYTHYNRIFGALGLKKFRSISATSATTPIIGLMPFYDADLSTTVYRMTPSKLHKLNTGTDAWDDVTGTDLNGASSTIPQFTVHKDTLCFVNDGNDRPRKLTPSGGNSADLGGTPPYAKAIWQGWGFLFLGNISEDGATFFPRRIAYSDDFDVDWETCDGNEINLNETNGAIVCGIPFGENVIVFKTDCLIKLGFEGGNVRFSQDKMQFGHGLIAPLSPAPLESFGVCFLDSALRLNVTTGYVTHPLPPFVQKKLDDTLAEARARDCVGFNYPDKDSYTLLYPLSGDTWLSGRITFNYRTGEFFHRTYSHEFVRAAVFRYNDAVRSTIIASTTNLVYQLDTEDASDDGTAIGRYYDFDWSNFDFPGEKAYKGATFNVKKGVGRVAVSVAVDYQSRFRHEQFFDLRGLASAGSYVTINYRPTGPQIKGNQFSTRIRLFHDDGSQVEVIPPATFYYEPLSEYSGVESSGRVEKTQ